MRRAIGRVNEALCAPLPTPTHVWRLQQACRLGITQHCRHMFFPARIQQRAHVRAKQRPQTAASVCCLWSTRWLPLALHALALRSDNTRVLPATHTPTVATPPTHSHTSSVLELLETSQTVSFLPVCVCRWDLQPQFYRSRLGQVTQKTSVRHTLLPNPLQAHAHTQHISHRRTHTLWVWGRA